MRLGENGVMTTLNGSPVTVSQLEALGLINYGHFTSMQVEQGTVRGLSMHLRRLDSDCRAVFGLELDTEQVRAYMRDLIADAGRNTLGIRITIFDPSLDMGRPSEPSQPHVLASIRGEAASDPPPLRVQSRLYMRDMPLVKHIGLFGTLAQRREAQLNGFDDALFVDELGNVSEGPTWNIGFIRDDEVVWPDAAVLPGVTMRLLKGVLPAGKNTSINLIDLKSMHAAFATNVTVGVRSISNIDDTNFSESESLTTLRCAFLAIEGEQI
jgi:branched-subunit amino acid aminotransferase/4-amino-4-deoxychorismate lyase